MVNDSIFMCEVEYYDELDNYNLKTERTLLGADTWGEACDRVRRYYGADTYTIKITEMEAPLLISKKIANLIIEEGEDDI